MTALLTMKRTFLAFATVTAFAGATAAFAAGGGGDGGGDGSQPAATETTKTCKNGQVWDEKKKECVDPQKSGFNDTELYRAAREFAYAGQYDNALKVLKLAADQNDPRILNYYGFTNRKLGNIDIAMDYYRRAIAIDGNYLLARSYMGQGLVKMGDLEGARAQLVEIRDRGGKDTYAYRALYEALKSGSTY